VVAEINTGVTGIQWLCSADFPHHHLILPDFRLGFVLGHTAHMMQPYLLALIEIGLLISYVHN